jgi:hypothetical protein
MKSKYIFLTPVVEKQGRSIKKKERLKRRSFENDILAKIDGYK